MSLPARRKSVAAVVGLLLLSGCVPASPDEDTYKGKASLTIGGASSEVSTVQDILELLHAHRIFRPAAITQMRDSQSSLDTNTGAFNEINPPPALDGLYQHTNTLLSDSTDTIRAARLAIERHETSRYLPLAHELGKLADRLDALEKQAE
jgi:hypothetical protein